MSDPNELSETQRRLARAALGLPNPRGRSYRNYQAVGRRGEPRNAWLGMTQRGLARELAEARSLVGYRLTRTGAEAALEPGETLDEEDFL